MEGEWLWVTSLRTNESGCVFKGLVQDIGDDVDAHEGKEWFHSIITKEQAYDLLMTGKDFILLQLLKLTIKCKQIFPCICKFLHFLCSSSVNHKHQLF